MIIALAVACTIGGHGAFTVPDNTCTPGARKRMSRARVCTSKDRPYLPVDERRFILASYGVPGWDGDDGELDHRIPFFLGGRTDRRNIWPEPGPIPNRKDSLERLAYERVCNGHMRIFRAVRWFKRDWRVAYRRHLG
jgi:hypothetical protein